MSTATLSRIIFNRPPYSCRNASSAALRIAPLEFDDGPGYDVLRKSIGEVNQCSEVAMPVRVDVIGFLNT